MRSTGETAYALLKQELIRGTVPPGARIRERDLATRFEVSRTPLREALLRLEQERMIERSETGAWRATTLGERDIRDIFSARAQLELLAMRLAIERGSDTEIFELGQYLEESERAFAAEDIAAMTEANALFHTSIYRVAHSPWLETVMEPLRIQTIRLRMIIAGHVHHPSYPEGHREIFDILVARDNDGAERVVRDHVEADLRVAIRHFEVFRAATVDGSRARLGSQRLAVSKGA